MPLLRPRAHGLGGVDVVADDGDQDIPVARVHLTRCNGRARPSQGSPGYNARMSSSTLDPGLAALLGRVWPRLPAGVAHAEALGFAWTDVSTPFVRREGERVVAHVGVVELPLVIAGRRVRVGSIHAVCTTPSAAAGPGPCADAGDAGGVRRRFETLVLTTLIPEFYTAFGFRPCRARVHAGAAPAAPGPSRVGACSPRGRMTCACCAACWRTRAPVSERFGSLESAVVSPSR